MKVIAKYDLAYRGVTYKHGDVIDMEEQDYEGHKNDVTEVIEGKKVVESEGKGVSNEPGAVKSKPKALYKAANKMQKTSAKK